MEVTYSKEEFEGFTHRFIVRLRVDEDWRNNISTNIYSNSGSYQKLSDFIEEKKSEKVVAFDIVHRATKEQDEASLKLLGTIL